MLQQNTQSRKLARVRDSFERVRSTRPTEPKILDATAKQERIEFGQCLPACLTHSRMPRDGVSKRWPSTAITAMTNVNMRHALPRPPVRCLYICPSVCPEMGFRDKLREGRREGRSHEHFFIFSKVPSSPPWSPLTCDLWPRPPPPLPHSISDPRAGREATRQAPMRIAGSFSSECRFYKDHNEVDLN